ncbi:hypothetical protein RhiJN_06986 [Ceratobasidium sp. AG-Ba]|nr:hypothetical protein RhiJN_06986 [Ceratobasidium sp. AG-Ba]QRW07872.1 hypothetical protein RhiLY_06871 [Ceratobasidium sp. AG-Ba]
MLILGLACATVTVVLLSGICIFLMIGRRLPNTPSNPCRNIQHKAGHSVESTSSNGSITGNARVHEKALLNDSDQPFVSEKMRSLGDTEEAKERGDVCAELLSFPRATLPRAHGKHFSSPIVRTVPQFPLPRGEALLPTRPLCFQPPAAFVTHTSYDNSSGLSWLQAHAR